MGMVDANQTGRTARRYRRQPSLHGGVSCAFGSDQADNLTAAAKSALTASIIVTCKGRRAQLERTLPLMLAQQCSVDLRVVVVDYGDPNDCCRWCSQLNHPRLTAVRVLDGTDVFNLSRARNCGANFFPADVFCFCDADSVISRHFVEFTCSLIRAGRAALTMRNPRDGRIDTCGVCCVSSPAFHAVRGYDEAFEGWGHEDSDLYARVRRVGAVIPFPVRYYPAALPHSDHQRTEFYLIKDIGTSARSSSERMLYAERVVNPGGYGRAAADIWHPGAAYPDRHVPVREPPPGEDSNG